MTSQALTPLHLYQATRVKIQILRRLQPRLGQTSPHQAFQTLLDQTPTAAPSEHTDSAGALSPDNAPEFFENICLGPVGH